MLSIFNMFNLYDLLSIYCLHSSLDMFGMLRGVSMFGRLCLFGVLCLYSSRGGSWRDMDAAWRRRGGGQNGFRSPVVPYMLFQPNGQQKSDSQTHYTFQ